MSMIRQQFDMAWKMLLPVAIGLGVVWWLFGREFDAGVLDTLRFDGRAIAGIVLAWVFMLGRDFGLTWRFRVLTDGRLSWAKAVKVCFLCEFTSCVTPTSVGGSALSMVFMHREGIEMGRATTLTMTTLFLDELFFVVSLPVVMLLVPYGELFGFGGGDKAFTVGLQTAFWIIYGVIVAWTLLLFMGIIVRPHAIRAGLVRLFSLGWLCRWRDKADSLGRDMEDTGRDLRHRPLRWWLEACGGTVLSWMSRYLVVNALFFGFAPEADQVIVLARQFVVWVILMVSPTPGGAGISEWLFTTYYGDLLLTGGMALMIALFWRIVSYYIYLVIGACMLPAWFREGIRRKNERKSNAKQFIE